MGWRQTGNLRHRDIGNGGSHGVRTTPRRGGFTHRGVALNGCGAATENSSTVSTSGTVAETALTSTSPSAPSPGPSASGSGSGSSGSPDTGLAWVPFGPDDPKFPTPGWDVYYYFLAHDCESLQSSVQTPGDGFGNLYKAAVAVCRAAVGDEESQWSVASEAFADRGDGVVIGPASCVDESIASMVSTLLAWHEKHPGQQPDLTFPQTADGRTACSRDNNRIAGPADIRSPPRRHRRNPPNRRPQPRPRRRPTPATG